MSNTTQPTAYDLDTHERFFDKAIRDLITIMRITGIGEVTIPELSIAIQKTEDKITVVRPRLDDGFYAWMHEVENIEHTMGIDFEE